jgi:DNA mismatch repair protein MutS
MNFSFDPQTFQRMEAYLGTDSYSTYAADVATSLVQKFAATFLRDEQYHVLYTGLLSTIEILNAFRDVLNQTEPVADNPYAKERQKLNAIFNDKRLQGLMEERNSKSLSFLKTAKYDHLLKHTLQKELEILLNGMYRLDVYLAVSNVAKVNGFHYAQALPKDQNVMHTKALRHPGLLKGVANPVSFEKDKNLMFLTGANMAGKSTFMKAFGIAIYLAHMGFPVAAEEMKFSVFDGMYSSINVADDLNMGHSHFYAEVLRVKGVAEEVSTGKKLVVLFDELFKGTNVKDAYDGTLSVTAAFSKYRNCFFIVSTHIIEVAAALKKEGGHILFAYLPTVMEGAVPRYTYVLADGITSDRQDMVIIENEGILDLLKE